MHPQDSGAATGASRRLQGNGFLGNVIANPLETGIFLAHMIFEGALDKFPNLRLCLAHGGGYLPAYPDRMDYGCMIGRDSCKVQLKKRPSEYLRQVYVDSLVFTPRAVRQLADVCGPNQIVIGTDDPVGWVQQPVDPILATPGLSDADKRAMLGETACRLLKIPV
jgi:aminocarboxymuconate-semialdehyde decarboxylase